MLLCYFLGMSTLSDSQKVAEILLKNGAVLLNPENPFTYASGIVSPIYCDNRLLLSDPVARQIVVQAFKKRLLSKWPHTNVIAGIATAGIPWSAWLAHELNLPLIYIRSKSKEHGRQNQIEGALPQNASCVLIEDLISTGKSSLESASAYKSTGAELLGCLSIFNYELKSAQDNFKKANVEWSSLTQLSSLLECAQNRGLITTEQRLMISEWQKNPNEWAKGRIA